jgi:hypothetical protein
MAVSAVGFAYISVMIFSGTSEPEPETTAQTRARQDVASGNPAFLTWHNGSKTHDVWGIGDVYAGAKSATVKCGDRSVPLTPTYDTASDTRYPKTEQTKVYARAYNQTVLEHFEDRGISCEF